MNDMNVLREALDAFINAVSDGKIGAVGNYPSKELVEYVDSIVKNAQNAISMPTRNCDVGTVEEQKNRYKQFCEKHSGWDGRARFGCLNCPFIDVEDCEFDWMQMPYEEYDNSDSDNSNT